MKGYATLCVLFFSYNDFKSFFLSGLLKYNIANFEIFCRQKIIVPEKKKEIFFERMEKIVGKGQNAGYQHFLHFP